MSDRDRKRLREIHTFPELVKYLKEDLNWPVDQASFDNLEDITFDWEADELGIEPSQAAKIDYIKQLRPLENGQPQGVFFVKFDAKSLPVVALRRLLSKLVIKKRATAGAAERPLWAMRDLVFISSYGESNERQLSFAYFQEPELKAELPSLKVLGWDGRDTALHLDRVHDLLVGYLKWPETSKALPAWRKDWSKAFELRHGQVVATAKELAEQLAALARGIRERANQLLKLETEKGPLRTLMVAFKTALIHDLKEDQFADMYAQTIAYGLLSARITHPDPVQAETLPDLIPVTNPFLKELMETFVLAGGKHRGKKRGLQLDFDELGINDVVELLRRANMDAVLRNFGADDRREDPVTYFYEDFLNAYDAQERKRRGVYYTPKPVVSYIVRGVHELLQTDFGIEDGLASTITWAEMAKRHKNIKIPQGVLADSPYVQVLDPATGTATFLVTIIELIFEIMTTRWAKEGFSEVRRTEKWNEYVPKHLLPRLYGYELMMAPYAIAHLKIGLKLIETGYKFSSEERARIYLTNALEPATDSSDTQVDALSEALAHEAKAVNDVKRRQRPTVVVGNPPYAGHSLNNQVAWIVDKVYDYKRGVPELSKPAQAKWLQDDYVKFIRFAEVTIESAGTGVLGFITNHSYLDNPTFRGMRHHLMDSFSRLNILDLHGNSKKREVAADGSPDENVFDIQQGVSIMQGTRTTEETHTRVLFADLLGLRTSKYARLRDPTSSLRGSKSIRPRQPFYLLRPEDATLRDEFDWFVPLPDAMSANGDPAPGIVTTHDQFAISWTKEEAMEKVTSLLRTRSEKEARELFRLCGTSQWNYMRAKTELATLEWRKDVGVVSYRPFDQRWTVYDSNIAVHQRLRASRHFLGQSNIGLCVGKAGQVVGAGEWNLVSCTNHPVDFNYFYRGGACNFPLYLFAEADGLAFRKDARINFGQRFMEEFSSIGLDLTSEPDRIPNAEARSVLGYIYSVLHSPNYRVRYAEFLKIDYPRIPLPNGAALFWELSGHGGALLDLHLFESAKLNNLVDTYRGPKNPDVGRVGWSDYTVWLDAEATKKGQDTTAGTIGFEGVGEDVWNFHIGGYQVCDKWLKDRKGRKLSKGEIQHYQKIVVALSETIRIMKEIDEVIEKHGGWPGAFHGSGQAAGD